MPGTDSRPITILVCALGGEGGGVLSQWLFDTALACGHSAQSTSIPGVAQRTGATTYYLEVHPEPDAALGGRRPVFSLNPVPGAIDLLVSSELLETVRQIGLGMASAERTTVISSSSRALTVAEKMQPGDGRVGDAALLATLQRHARAAEVFDMSALARETGTVISAVLLGAIAASGVLPFAREAYEATIRRSGRGVDASLAGFARAYERVAASRRQRAQAEQALQAVTAAAGAKARDGAPALPVAVRDAFPAAVHDVLALGHARLVDYQDARYAALYVQRLARVLDAERAGDPGAALGHATTREAARWLALWMAFDDIVRVAHLKLRAARAQRVRAEVGARDDELVKVYDHFKPGVPEFAALLPQPLADRLLAWDARRRAQGRAPWALPLKVGTHTVLGALALRTVAALKGQRRRGSRFALEQSLIERWLAAVEHGAREHAALGHELAQCGRLIKGYGSTNERGKENLLHIVDHLATRPVPPAERAAAVRAAREAALADEGGRALDRALVAHGAPPRPPKPQPVRFYRRRPQT
ncbi:indolepyruvate oxidoreductase subunit beta family protein [Calidifontimicrobium sp. SYSU G02091]|uniref:indolepyruvate oxidoreductase subunit beta family protein n=1 Tax=Calidifontimicrobium sp. SYSU G02091 TaxID=2926421 RepID=UPI001F53AD52|nr:indolepyruvate oxidoreductase subunit beta family protein [Calidifontimicrobium sp. SYSU G02091]MCI1192197.1 indolepyruvate oxidoreductase subunit beta family protein [Calidifontimicrobium sp. SYSU G02091]